MEGAGMDSNLAAEDRDGSAALLRASDRGGDEGAPRSLAIARQEVNGAHDFSRLMGALVADVVEGRISPQVANAASGLAGRMLKLMEIQYKHNGGLGALPDDDDMWSDE